MPRPNRILITGTSRGLGLEFAARWLKAGSEVFALARNPEGSEALGRLASAHPERLHVAACDVGDDASVAAARRKVGEAWESLDLLINNAGTYRARSESLEDLKLEDFRAVMEVNALGPLRVSRAFLDLLRKGSRAGVVNMTSLMGSIDDNTSGGSWSYRTSKAALNMITRNLAHHLERDEIPCISLHPGWVRTDMGGRNAPLPIEESVSAMISTIEALDMKSTGRFLDRNGEPLPW